MNSNMILKETIHLKNLRSYSALWCGGGLFTQRCSTLATPWTVALQTPLSMGFSRQEYCRVLPFPSPRDLHNPRMNPESPPLQADSLPTEPTGKPIVLCNSSVKEKSGAEITDNLELYHKQL